MKENLKTAVCILLAMFLMLPKIVLELYKENFKRDKENKQLKKFNHLEYLASFQDKYESKRV